MEKKGNGTKKEVVREINLDDPQQIKRWCSALQCNEMRLRNAVRAVGYSEDAVRTYMKKKF
jgi:hypothetical protein